MNLFELGNNVVTFSPQALLIAPFKEIWDKDKSKGKEDATLKLAFIYYMADERSDFIHILNTDDRVAEINMDERDERSNKPIHDIGKITASVEKIPRLIKAINEIEKEVIKEKAMKAQSGNRTQSMFDEGI